jgi:hypothetical protein
MSTTEIQHRTPVRRQTSPFDTLSYARSMESVGFTRQQAEMMAQEQAKLINDRLTTKEDADLINANIETTADRTKSEILRWMFGSIAGQTVILLGAMIGILRAGVH